MDTYGQFTFGCELASDSAFGVASVVGLGIATVAVWRVRINLTWPVRVSTRCDETAVSVTA